MKKILVLAFCFLSVLSIHAQENYKIIFDKSEYDFGKINEEKGKVEAIFYFTNLGKVPVKIEDVNASCGCTATDYTKDDVAPNKSGFVKATFDPAYRTGPFSKTILVRTNSFPVMLTLSIKGDVIAKPKGPEDWYPTISGQTRFSTNHFSFGEVTNNTTDTASVKWYNNSDKTISITSIETTPYVKFTPSSMQVKPHEAITIMATLDGTKVGDLGFLFDQGHMFTTDTSFAEKLIYVSATINQYFPKLSKKDSIAAPRIHFEKITHSWGEITEGDIVGTEFKFTNTGKKNLEILKTKTSCGCTASNPSKSILKPGESATINVSFNSKNREGEETKTVTVITNDPYHSNSTLTVTSIVKRKN